MWMTVQTLKPRFTLASPCRRPCFPLSCRCSSTFSLTSHPCVCLSFSASDPFSHLLLPVRSRHQHPVDNAGLFSFMTLHWLSPLARKAYKASSLSLDDVWGLSCHEASEINCQRWGHRCTASRFIPVKKKKIFVLKSVALCEINVPLPLTFGYTQLSVSSGRDRHLRKTVLFSRRSCSICTLTLSLFFLLSKYWETLFPPSSALYVNMICWWTYPLSHVHIYTRKQNRQQQWGKKKKKKTSPKSKAVSSAVWEREATQWC